MEHREGSFQGYGGLTLFYQCWLPGKKPQTVLAVVHGFGEHSGRYMNVVNHFAPRGHAVYALDHRGHGRSPGKRGHINRWEEYREDVWAFVQMVAREEPQVPIFLWAHSMGALIGLDYIIAHPEGLRGAIISGAPIEPAGVAKPHLVALARIFSGVWPSFTGELGLDPNGLSRDPAVCKAYEDDPLVHGKGTARWGTEAMATEERVRSHAADIKIPILLIHGEADPFNRASGILWYFEQVGSADKEVKIYPGGYHEPHNDTNYQQVMEDVEGWVKRHL